MSTFATALEFNPFIVMLSEPPTRIDDEGTQIWDIPTADKTRGPREPVYIAGYASIVIKDKEEPIPHLVTTEALKKAMKKFMAKKDYRNIQLRHTNVQVAKVVDSYHSKKDDKTYTTHVDDNGLFIVAEVRDDIDAARIAIQEIRDKTLNSFSIAGEATDARILKPSGDDPFLKIDDLELWEITICEEGKNPGAKFVVVKQFTTDKLDFAPTTASQRVDGDGLVIDQFLPYWQKPIRIFREFVTLVGGLAEFGKTAGDVDILFRVPEDGLDFTPFEFRIQRAIPDVAARDRINFLYGDQGGPFTSYYPLYDLILMPTLEYDDSRDAAEHVRIQMSKAIEHPRIKAKRSRNLRETRKSMKTGLSHVYKLLAAELTHYIEDGPRLKGLKNALRKATRVGVEELEDVLTDAVSFSLGYGRKIATEYVSGGRLLRKSDSEVAKAEDPESEDVQDLVSEATHSISESIIDMTWSMIRKAHADGLSWMETSKAVKDTLLMMAEEPEPLRFVKSCEGFTVSKQVDEGEYVRRLTQLSDAQLIARLATIINTVTSDSINFGMLKQYRDEDVVTVEVLDDEFPTSCKDCEEVNGSVWTVGYALRKEMRLQHPNCVRMFRPIGIGA